jgi:hypothetical protein
MVQGEDKESFYETAKNIKNNRVCTHRNFCSRNIDIRG